MGEQIKNNNYLENFIRESTEEIYQNDGIFKKMKMVKRNPSIINRTNLPGELIQLNSETASILRGILHTQQGGKCPILKQKVNFDDIVLDHKHKLKAQLPGPKGRGLVRGALQFQVNGFEGQVLNKYKRQGLSKLIPLPELLRNLADYLDQPTCRQLYIYPSEKVMAPFLKISEYKRIIKYYFVMFPRRKKAPPYPPSKIKKVGKKKKGQKQKYKYVARISNKWRKLLDEANAIHINKGRTIK